MVNVFEPPRLRDQGAISVSPRGGWHLGQLSLADSTFIFGRPGSRGALRIDLKSVTRLQAERRAFVLGTKRVLRLTYQLGPYARPRTWWLLTARLGDWEAALSRCIGHPPEPAVAAKPRLPASHTLAIALAALPGPARLVVEHLAHRGPATTAELMSLIGADTEEALHHHLLEDFQHLDVVLGGPAVRYTGRWFDRRLGTIRRQSWQVHETVAENWLASCTPTDVLMEDNEVLVVTSVPTRARGVPLAIHVDTDGRGLVLCSDHGYVRWIGLPEEVVGEVQCTVGDTGTLIARARRKAPGTSRTAEAHGPTRG